MVEKKEKIVEKVEEVTPLNIYQKLQTIRCELQTMSLKKSGHNTFAKYNYYELKDFLPAVNVLMQKHGVCTLVNFAPDSAALTIINADNPNEQIMFTSPVADAALKGCTPVQNLGAVQTYIRRYLYTNAFEIVEDDALDAATGKNGSAFISDEQRNMIADLVISKQVDEAKFLKYIGADAIERIPAGKYTMAIAALNRKGNGNANTGH